MGAGSGNNLLEAVYIKLGSFPAESSVNQSNSDLTLYNSTIFRTTE